MTCLVLVGAVFLAYGSGLGQFFRPIDDPLLLWSVREGLDPTPRFRPLYAVWNGWLFGLFGTRPFGWYLAGLLVHAANVLLVAYLALRVAGRPGVALVAGLCFAVFYSPNEAVLWIAANCGLMCVLFVLLGGAAWSAYLEAAAERRPRRWLAYAAATAALALAMGFKEECVLAGPLFLGLDLCRNGWRALRRPGAWARYAPLAALAALYLAVAFRPESWAAQEGVGQYDLGPGLAPEMLQELAVLFWPRATYVQELVPVLVAAGAALALLVVLGCRGDERTLARLGLALALFALLPALPGPYPIAGTRYAYPASVGAAMIAAAAFRSAWRRLGSRPARAVLAAGLLGWLALEVRSIHSVQEWRYESSGARLQRMLETSDAVLGARPALVVGPRALNAHDYFLSLCLWLEVERSAVSAEPEPADEAFFARFRAGGEHDPGAQAVFGCREDGALFRVRSGAELPLELWRAQAEERERFGRGRTLELVRVETAAAR